MKFKCTVEINKPIDQVIPLFDSLDNLKEWQDGFISHKHLSGEPGKVGAKSELVYENRGNRIELIETIVKNELPSELTATYEHKHMDNTMSNYFKELGDGRTLYEAHIHYTAFHGFMPRLMAMLFPSMFKKQTQKWLNQFKAFVENQA